MKSFQADDEHADSLRKHPVPASSRFPKNASAGGACDFFEEPVEALGTEREDSLSERGNTCRTMSEVSSASLVEEKIVGNSLGLTGSPLYLPEDDRISKLHSSLGWELAHLLHVCLGHYLKPGGASPGVSC